MFSEKPKPSLMELFRVHCLRAWNYRIIIFLSLTVICLSVLFYALSGFIPAITETLELSSDTPWGIITSMLIHGSSKHLVNNVLGLALFTACFVGINLHIPKATAEKRGSVAALIAVSTAIFSNVLWLFLVPHQRAIGASGIVYALLGVTAGFCSMNLTELLSTPVSVYAEDFGFRKTVSEEKRKKVYLFLRMTLLLPNAGVLILILVTVLLRPALFLSVSPGVNVIVHGVAFITALASSAFYSTIVFHLSRRQTENQM